ncbi:MAG: Response regulator receiver protein [Parcubacteria group bacterium Gr01-1014_20]|nr:MAG: Response regulator receiver protein [Parcubacteria group bacterium Gr01-1014_20]
MKKQIEQKKIILVIEDEQSLLKVVNARLEKKGFGVITARSVDQVFNSGLGKKGFGVITANSIKQALHYLENLEKIDAIWLDHNLLGKEDGLDFVKKLKANGGRWEKIPIFVVSNTENSKTIQSYLDLGVSKYYVKSNHRLDEIIKDINLSLDNLKA